MTGFRHDAGLFASAEEMLDTIVPLLDEVTANGTPAVVRFDDDLSARLHDRVARPERIDFVDGAAEPNPVRAVRSATETAQGHLDGGAVPVLLVGTVPHDTIDSDCGWEHWARYEAALNERYAGFPVWGICCYPTVADPRVEADVLATHTRLVGREGWRENPSYVDPRDFVAGRTATPAELLGSHPPAFELHDPHPSIARESVRRLGERAALGAAQVDDLVLGANEVVTNAFLHGQRPVVVRGWVADGGLLLSVRDGGGGVADPFLGMFAPDGERAEPGGYGVWMARMCADLVTFRRDAEGFTVRMAVQAR